MPNSTPKTRSIWILPAAGLGLAGALWAAGASPSARGPVPPNAYHARSLYQVGSSVAGHTVTDLRTPYVPGGCNARFDEAWEFLEFSGASEPQLCRCRLGGTFDDPVCDGTSECPLDLADPIQGINPPFGWNSLDSTDGSTCQDPGSAVAMVGTVSPPLHQWGILVDPFLGLVVVIKDGEPIPAGGGATFTSLNGIRVRRDTVAYTGTGTGGKQGIYTFDRVSQVSTVLADDQVVRPRGTGNFTAASDFAVFAPESAPGTNYVAWADGGGVYAAPADLSTPIVQLVAPGDPYAAGRAVRTPFSQLAYMPPNRIVFHATSQAFHEGIYSVALDTPGVLLRHADDETTYNAGAGSFGFVQNPTGADGEVYFEAFNGAFQYLGAFVDRDLADGEVEPFLLRNDPFDGKTVQTVVVDRKSALRGGEVSMVVYFTDGTGGAYLLTQVLLFADFEEGDFSEWSSTSP